MNHRIVGKSGPRFGLRFRLPILILMLVAGGVALLSSDVLAGRGGGFGGGRGGGFGGGMNRGGFGGGFNNMNRGGFNNMNMNRGGFNNMNMNRGGFNNMNMNRGNFGYGHSPSFSSARTTNFNAGDMQRRSVGYGGVGGVGNRANPYAGGVGGVGNRANPYAAAGVGAAAVNRNTGAFPNAGAAVAGAGVARNRMAYPNAGAAVAGAAFANRYPYNRFHAGWLNGYWHGNYAAAWGYGGVAAWGLGSALWAYGYSNYQNPYFITPAPVVIQQQVVTPSFDYSQPINTSVAPPADSVTDPAIALFDQARDAFKKGDYDKAIDLVNQASAKMPNDTNMHEFLGLCLFAKGRYDQAAGPVFAVLSVGPGWDWTTLIGMYADASTYTTQLRALEQYRRTNPQSAPATFVLAYHYLCQGHDKAAADMFARVVKLQPNDTVSAQILGKLQPPTPSASASPSAPASTPSATAAAPASNDVGKLTGIWVAESPQKAKITLTLKDDDSFTWAVAAQGKPPISIAGKATLEDGVLSLAGTDAKAGTFAGDVTRTDDAHFRFVAVGAVNGDPGLNFARTASQ